MSTLITLNQLDQEMKTILDFSQQNPITFQTDLYRIDVEQFETKEGWKKAWEIRIGYYDSFYKWQEDILKETDWIHMAQLVWKHLKEKPKGHLYPAE